MQPNWFARAAYFLLRVVAGLMMLQAGGKTLFGWLGGMPQGMAPPAPFTQGWIGAALQVVGGTLIILGLFTRFTAFILSGEMAVAYWQFHYMTHGPGWTWPIQNDGMPAVLLSFIFLLFAVAGGGMLSVDESIALRRTRAAKLQGGKPAGK
jgi:putative oxidoreductase